MGDIFTEQFTDPFGTDIPGLRLFKRLSGAEGIKADAKSRENLANFNAQVAENEAIAKRQATKFASKRQAEKGARVKSTLKTRIAAGGGVGSPVAEDLAAEQATELELENLLLGFEGEVSATQSERQAKLDTAAGRIAIQRGKNQALAANVKLGTTLLAGFA
jgi:hypothetical protein